MYGYKALYRNNPSLQYRLFDRLPSQPLESLVTSLKKLPTSSRVLDLGCGDGILEYLAGADRNYRFTSLDLEPQAIERLENIFLSHSKRGDEALVGDMTNIAQISAITSRRYKVCISWRVLHGISPNKYATIFSDVYNLLESGGSFIVSVASTKDWKRYALGNKYDPNGVNDCREVMFHDFGIPRTTPFPVHFFTLEELETLGEENGFEVTAHGYFKESSGYEHLNNKQNTYLFVRFSKK